jgi:alpha-L-fucosidase
MELEKKLMDFNGRKVVVLTAAAPKAAPSLDDKTKAELIALAESRDVEVSSRMTKAKIIEALESADV